MAGLLKNQILKHLSKFVKNLSPNHINLSTLKGEGELRDLELDEDVLTCVLDLPTWLQLTKAICNRVSIKIQWTKLKSQPICMYLDEVEVTMVTCDTPRKPNADSPISSYSNTPGKYGFAEGIIDGMYLSINSVVVNFNAKTFVASIQLSRITIESKTPTWHTTDNLRHTRLKDERRGEILLFKEAEWMTLRIVANALEGSDSNLATTPLRLIAHQSKIRITMKKKLGDCGIIASRLHINLDDLLWVLTDSQLKAALVFLNSLRDVIQKSAKQSKKTAAEKLKKQGHIPSTVHPGQRQQHPHRPLTKSQQAVAKVFERFDIRETSYHLYTGRVDLHLCDDAAPEDADHRRKLEGGAMQVTFFKMALDFYPFHPAETGRKHWLKYDSYMEKRDQWAEQLLSAFKDDVRVVREAYLTPFSSPAHDPCDPTKVKGQTRTDASLYGKSSSPHQNPVGHTDHQHGPAEGHTHPQITGHKSQQLDTSAQPRPTKLLESCTIFRLEDFALYRVSTALDHKRSIPKKFMTSDKQRLLLPPEMSSVHAEYTDYYFPEGIDYPVPHSNLYVIINPVYLKMDFLTVLWLNAFLLNILRSADIPQTEGPKIHTDIRLEALMPRIVIPADTEVLYQSDRPDGLQIQASQLTISNCRLGEQTSRLHLLRTLDEFNRGRLFKENFHQFPRDQEDLVCVAPNFGKYLDKEDSPYFDKTVESILHGKGIPDEMQRVTNELINPLKRSQSTTGLTYYNMMSDSFKMDATKDIWSVMVDQLWVEFVGVPSSRNRPVPFVESFPLSVWIAQPLISLQSASSVSVRSRSESSLSSSASEHSVCEDKPQRSHSRQLLKDFYNTDTLSNSSQKPDFKLTSSSQPTKEQVEDTRSIAHLADVHLITHISSKVSIQLNHYQYLFLMRLMDTVSKFQEELEEDTIFINKAPLPEKKLSISVIVKEIEVALICPPIPEIPSMQISPADSEDLIKEIHACNVQPVEIQGADGGDSALGVSLQSSRSHDCNNGTLIHKSSSEMDVFSDESPEEVQTDLCSMSVSADVMRSDLQDLTTFPHIHISESSLTAEPITRSRSGSPASRTSPAHSNGSVRGHLTGTPKHGNATEADMKKPFSAMANFTKGMAKKINKVSDKVKQNMNKKDMLEVGEDGLSISDDLETMSLKSGSSDEDDYIMTKFQNQMEVPAFESKFTLADDSSVIDSGSEFRDADLASVRARTDDIDRAQGVVSVVCFKIHNSEAAISMKGDNIAVAATVDHVIPEEHGNVNLDKFHDRFLNIGRGNWSVCC